MMACCSLGGARTVLHHGCTSSGDGQGKHLIARAPSSGGILHSFPGGIRVRPIVIARAEAEQPEKRSGLLNSAKPQLAVFVSALSLLGIGSIVAAAAAFTCGRRDSVRFAHISSTVSFAPEILNQKDTNPHVDPADSSGGEIDNLDPDLKSAFEDWKSVPYAITVPLRIVGLRGSMPPIWLKDFTLSQGKRLKLSAEFQGSLNAIFSELSAAVKSSQVSARSTMAADVVTLGDSWLGAAINNGVIVPVGRAEQLDWFQRLDERWQAILQRDEKGRPSTTGDVWGAPYRCGCMVIAFRKDKLAKAGVEAVKDWEDLWRPELTGKISMVDSPREVIGLVLKSLGASYNAKDFDKEVDGGKQAVKDRFLRLRKQVRVFDDVNYLKALGAGDVWVAVGWSTDVLPFAKRSSNIGVVAPASGTSLWADLWAIPATSKIQSDKVGGRTRGPSPLVSQWLDFCLQPARSLCFQQGALSGASPLNLTREDVDEGPMPGPSLDTNVVSGLPPRDILHRSEFLEPLDPHTAGQYQWVVKQDSPPLAPRTGIFSLFWQRRISSRV